MHGRRLWPDPGCRAARAEAERPAPPLCSARRLERWRVCKVPSIRPLARLACKQQAPSLRRACMASALPACEPPLMMLKAGTGRMSFLLPARSDRCLYSGTPFSAAPACAPRSVTFR